MPAPFPQRKSPRLKGYDYRQAGAYFVTICTHDRLHLFGTIKDERMHLSPAGEIAQEELQRLPERWPTVELDYHVVMPNHIHAILLLLPDDTHKSPVLGSIIGMYKAGVSRRVHHTDPALIVWQSRYHDHIIRDDNGLHDIRNYILNNPLLWEQDTFYGD